jgi:hypothetical protein
MQNRSGARCRPTVRPPPGSPILLFLLGLPITACTSTPRQALTLILTEYAVQVVFIGQHHNCQLFSVDGVAYVVTGRGGARLYPLGQLDPDLAAYAIKYHTVCVALDGSIVTAVAVSAEGEEVGHLTLSTTAL